MNKKVELTELKAIHRLFKDSFKKKLIQQIEEKIITAIQARAKYGVNKSVLSEWKAKFGKL